MNRLGQMLIDEGMEKGIEKGIEQGIEKGIEKGIELNQTDSIKKLMKLFGGFCEALFFCYCQEVA